MIKVNSGEQFGISYNGTVKNTFWNKGDFGNIPREHGETDCDSSLQLRFIKELLCGG